MKIRSIFILIFFFFVAACVRKDKVPEDILPEEKMQAVLWDMMRADQFLNDYIFSKDSAADKKIQSSKMYAQIMALHNTNWEDFRRSFKWYSQHTERLKAIMDSIAAQAPAAPKPEVKPVADTVRSVLPQGTDTAVHQEKLVPHKDSVKRKRLKIKPLRVE